ncbi:prepilin-type N-terminal cleavage/methylation domain-containing protein [Massilia sp. BKSP1R2A-1]|uniref:prepilin-type N-terminal cleavage/methylation domain-containing protein n=1 Tax=Massilia sp. BKSP1R2A-1 TaxID=3422595 RepID=UPI003D33D3C1
MYSRRMAGVTLVELVIAIVIIAAALAGLVAALTRANRASVDPILTQQMTAIAEGMMEEVLLKPFLEDDSVAATGRADYNDIWDYNKYAKDSPVEDFNGNAIAGLERYRVSVQVDKVALTNIPLGDAARVRVTVRNGGQSIVLNGWRTKP